MKHYLILFLMLLNGAPVYYAMLLCLFQRRMNKLFRCIFTVILVGVSSVIMAQDGLGAMNANSYRVGLNKSRNTSLLQDSKNNPGKSFLYEGRAENIEQRMLQEPKMWYIFKTRRLTHIEMSTVIGS